MLPNNAEKIDFSQLRDCSHKEVTLFLLNETNDLVMLVRERVTAALQQPPLEPAPYDRIYCPDDMYDLIMGRNDRSDKRFLGVIFAALIFTATRYDTTVSQLLYNWQMPVVPPRKICGLLHLFSTLPETDRRYILRLLESEPLRTQNIPYILKSRLEELAADQGYHFPDIIWFSTYAANVSVTRLPDFASALFREKDLLIQENDKRYLGSMQYFRMLLLLSYTYSVAPERLLLQDYSAQAVQPDGTPFSPEQIQFLGAYLRGTSHVQTLASNEILALSCGLS